MKEILEALQHLEESPETICIYRIKSDFQDCYHVKFRWKDISDPLTVVVTYSDNPDLQKLRAQHLRTTVDAQLRNKRNENERDTDPTTTI